ncbi:hypothetical protein F0224_07720 [Vibrio coralliilyticus]|uniref:Uncharacterized protein n=1 Tax=Vibrio coralliilyticus TaxID=190893 RepID=A0AAP6ZWB0_9VIBR|nr:hypothetical protein [Vibrio coralliilyticus]ARC92156.1 hypothetical protein B6A42_08655 [Vibrio coralliilyticus]AXN33063.1 hypothetical protein DVV14_17495 [Vibrio coralliilyticus]ERB65531.1 hypothetical protein N779_09440 [Vibrio coralliilyticus OCN008]KPH23817.1 hypothetical protein ADU60_20610 [Vibrio coralliilyticus]NOI20785.1 hypothetical protein [Vibrio coralliilyticus]
MIPGISGGLTNSGSMPINASGGHAGPSSATARNSFGGIRNGSINFGGGGVSSWLPWVALTVVGGLLVWKSN